MTYYNIVVLKYEKLILGELQTNCYVVWDEFSKETVVIDPADDGVEIAQEIATRQLKMTGILLTHGHFDHVLGALDLKLIDNVPIYGHSDDFFLLSRQQETANHFLQRQILVPNLIKLDVDLKNIKSINVGGEKLKVIKTPGHTPGSVCFYNKLAGYLFSGDTIFAEGQRGATNHTYSSTNLIYESIYGLLKLPSETLILSGHGEETTVATEKERYKK